ncbi:amidohydrolase family protein [Emcibacter sp.]|uniref:amidohydrolase family protein n=1 Tax=Emcibacter sp. TaxID=1979954 RepID=UPI003A948F17
MIIDAHAHLIAPASIYSRRYNSRTHWWPEGNKIPSPVDDEALEASVMLNLEIMDSVGTDIQILSPRPFLMLNGEACWEEINDWTTENNNLIARAMEMFPRRFRGIGCLPQKVDYPVETVFDEIDRCINELGFIGILLNPDTSEGMNSAPPLGDPYWYPLYEKLCAMDLPAHVHSGNCINGRVDFDEHFIAEDTLAVSSIYKAGVFRRFPELKLMISHGGGAIPYQIGRWRSHYQKYGKDRIYNGEGPTAFDGILKLFWFDTVLQSKESLELLFRIVGSERCCFGTERPGNSGGVDPHTKRSCDDLKPVIESIPWLTDEQRRGVFEENVRRLFTRLNL